MPERNDDREMPIRMAKVSQGKLGMWQQRNKPKPERTAICTNRGAESRRFSVL